MRDARRTSHVRRSVTRASQRSRLAFFSNLSEGVEGFAMFLLYLTINVGVAVALVACVCRAISYSMLPIHLRWELYPVPHEAPQHAQHGGSCFEETDWWAKPEKPNRLGELRVMIPEMLFMKGLWEANRPLWNRSFPFHFGLYLLAGTLGLVIFAAFLQRLAPSVAGNWGTVLRNLYKLTGYAGLLLGLWGSMALLHRRLTDAVLRNYTHFLDVLNLGAFTLTFALLLAGLLLRSSSGPTAPDLVRAICTYDTGRAAPALLVAGMACAALLTAYIPFTHMIHFVAKYFMYHAVRWDDRPNRRGGILERQVAEYLTYRPTWSARHVGADGTKSWAAVATSNPAAEVKP